MTKEMVEVPGSWSETKRISDSSSVNYGTYHLRIRTPSRKLFNTLYLRDIASAYKLYIDGQLIYENGVASSDPEKAEAKRDSKILILPEGLAEFDLFLQVSNYEFSTSGIVGSIFIGNQDDILAFSDSQLRLDFSFIGLCAVMAFYHFGIFIQRKNDKAYLYFAVYCLLLAFYILTSRHHLNSLMGQFYSFSLDIRIEFLSFYLGTSFFVFYLKELFPHDKLRWINYFFLSAGVLLSVPVLIMPPRIFMFVTLPIQQIIALMAIGYAFFLLFRALKGKQSGSVLILSGFILFAVSIILDIGIDAVFHKVTHFSQYGFMIFIFIQALFLSNKFTKAFFRIDALSEDLKSEKRSLEQKVADRTRELIEVNEDLKEMDRSKTSFFANISHELRSPITHLKLSLEAIIKGQLGPSLPVGDMVLKRMYRQTGKLQNQVENLLKFAKMELDPDKLHKRYIDLYPFLKFYVSEMESTVKAYSLDIVLNDESPRNVIAWMDTDLFESALLNLITNAMKFTPAGGRIEISLYQEDMISISVSDNGSGIPEDQQQAIFEKFYQVCSKPNCRKEGVGIGLSLVKDFAVRHDGNVSLESMEGEGSCFTIRLPIPENIPEHAEILQKVDSGFVSRIVADPPAETSSFGITPAGSSNERILLVEDNQDLADSLRILFEGRYRLHYASDGMEAMEYLLSSSPPDLIISDLMMPQMDGLEFLQKVRDNPRFAHIPFIILTAKASSREIVTGMKDGAVDYILKPFKSEILLYKIDNLLSLARNQKELLLAKMQSAIIAELNGPGAETTVDPEKIKHQYGFTERQMDILPLVRQRLSKQEISDQLKIRFNTVSTHLRNIYLKAGVNGREELIRKIYGS